MVLDLVQSVRRAKRTSPGLARAAADWEIELTDRLATPDLRLVAEEEPQRDEPEEPTQEAGNGGPH